MLDARGLYKSQNPVCGATRRMMAYTAVSASGNFAGGGDLYLWGGGGMEKRFSRKKNWAGVWVCPVLNREASLFFWMGR